MIFLIFFCLLVLSYQLCLSVGAVCSSNVSRNIDGEILIGGIFPLHERSDVNTSWTTGPPTETCVDFYTPYYMAAAAARFAVLEIKQKRYIDLGDLKLGYNEQEFCNSPVSAAGATLNLTNNSKVIAIVSGALSSSMITIGPIVAHYSIATIATWATSEMLTDKNIYRTLFRTVSGDQSQSLLLAQMAEYFGWQWVGAIGTDDTYGRNGLRMFIDELKVKNICVAFETYLQVTGGKEERDKFLEKLNASTVEVIFFYTTVDQDLDDFFQTADNLGVSPKVWIATDGWADLSRYFYKYKCVASVLGVTISDKPLPYLVDHLSKYDTIRKHNSIQFLDSFVKWMCDNQSITIPNCSDEILCKEDVDNKTITLIELAAKEYLYYATNYEAYTTYIAVYAIAQALKDIQECNDGKGLLDGGDCPDINNLERWQLVTYLEKVNFTDNNGSTFQFLENRQTAPSYIILNGKQLDEGVELVEVGSYKHGYLDIQDTAIYWANETYNGKKPSAICNDDCKAGTRRHYIENEQRCCFRCLPCSGNTISNTTNADTCLVCGQDQYANNNRTICLKKSPDVFLWDDSVSIIFCIVSVVGSLATVAVSCIFYKHRSTPVVKASSLSHSFVLAFVLFFSFQMVYFYIGIPTDTLCKVKSIIGGLNLTAILGIFCAKLYVIVKIFNNKLNFKIPTKLFYRYSWMLVAAITALHLAFNVILEIAIPSHVVHDYNNSITILPIFCNETDAGFIVTNIYQLILSLMCFIFAFRARNLPKNFQEARFIWFIMFTWCILGIFSIPAHFTAAGKLKICFQVIFLLLFNFLTLSAFYFSKCYLIYFRPDKNTRENLRKEIREQRTYKPSEYSGVPTTTLSGDEASLGRELSEHNNVNHKAK
ncbi:extracellular calcium-sensing receptor-like [Anneissia japonica]|uniref:extracellular calcium-sensing receptor-like n=1 Tax=Anneissia japonica TaxID=1529436 RepID=UPI0014259F7D|nr:extracellular calcium-sensing receptor-like [Anneissia japonica]